MRTLIALAPTCPPSGTGGSYTIHTDASIGDAPPVPPGREGRRAQPRRGTACLIPHGVKSRPRRLMEASRS